MVATPSKLAALAALLLAAVDVDATSIENNPVTILEAVVPMTDAHPAYGGPVREIKPVVVPDNTDEERAAGKVITNTSAVEIRSAAYRKLEGAPTDMAKLEKYFGTKLEVNYKKLLSSCKKGTPHQIPWPSSYWPVYMDSINARWTNEASPAEKYAKAFGKDVTKFMDTVSQVNGIDGFSSYKKCTSNPDCASDGSTCAKRAGKSSGYCIPTWYGICHAWAPASNWEPEPQCDVVKNGVTFHPYDLKGLVSAIYDGAQINTVFTGTRFYGPDSPDTKDKYGRYTDAQRRDLGAGFFHIAIANIMCLQGHSFVVDVTAGAEVWNQPVSGYEVIESTIMDPAKAGKEHFGTNNYPFNDAAKYVAYTKTRFSYIIEAYEDGPLVPNKLGPYTTTVDYEYFVELDASYNVIGGEWLGDTRYNHPDFLWFATGTPSLDTVTKIGLSYKEVRAMIDESVACKGSSTPAPTTPAPTTPAPTTVKPTTTPTPTTVKPTTTPAATTVKPTTTPAATTATPTSTPVATTVKPTSTPAVTTDKPSVTTPAPTDKPSVTTPAPTTDKPTATTPTPTTASPSTGATPVPTTVAPPAGKPTPPGGKPTPAPEPSTDAPPAGKPTPPGGKPTPPAGKPTPAPEPSTDAPPAGKPTPPGGKPTPPAGKPTPAPEPSTASPSTGATPVPTTVAPPAGKPTPAPEPSTDAPPAGKPTPPAETPASGGVPPPGKVTPPGDDDSSEDDDVPVPPSSGSGKPTPVPETPAVTPAVTTAAPPAGKPTPAPSATTVAPPSDDGKGTVSPPGGDDDENDDTPVTPGSGSGKPTPPAPVPDSGSGKPTPPAPVPAPVPAPATSGSGSGKPTPPAPAPAPDSGAGKPTPPAPVPAPVPAPGSGAGKPTPPSTGSDREASSGSDAPTPAPTKKNKKHKLCH